MALSNVKIFITKKDNLKSVLNSSQHSIKYFSRSLNHFIYCKASKFPKKNEIKRFNQLGNDLLRVFINERVNGIITKTNWQAKNINEYTRFGSMNDLWCENRTTLIQRQLYCAISRYLGNRFIFGRTFFFDSVFFFTLSKMVFRQ